MRRGVAQAIGAALIVLATSAGGRDAIEVARRWETLGPLGPGALAPALSLPLADGGRLTDAALRGEVTVLTFWATWCGACRSELADLDALARARAGQPVRFVAVNVEGARATEAEAFARERGWTLPVAHDSGRAAAAYGVGPIPHTVVIDPAGRVRHVHQGRMRTSTLERELDALVAE